VSHITPTATQIKRRFLLWACSIWARAATKLWYLFCHWK